MPQPSSRFLTYTHLRRFAMWPFERHAPSRPYLATRVEGRQPRHSGAPTDFKAAAALLGFTATSTKRFNRKPDRGVTTTSGLPSRYDMALPNETSCQTVVAVGGTSMFERETSSRTAPPNKDSDSDFFLKNPLEFSSSFQDKQNHRTQRKRTL